MIDPCNAPRPRPGVGVRGASAAFGLAALLALGACGPSRATCEAAIARSQALLKRNQQLEVEAARREMEELRGGGPEARAARLAALQRHAREQAARLAALRAFVAAVRGTLGQRGIEVKIRRGRMLVAIPAAVLFDPGQAELRGDARNVLTQVARQIRRSGRNFRVVGHTDNLPINDARFRSNWELSTARAVAVVHFFLSEGVAPTQLAAVGRADTEPVADNGTVAGRAANRRIEIVLEADLAEVVQLGAALAPASRPAR